MSLEQVFFIVFGVWLLILTVIFGWLFNRLNGLTKNVKEESLVKVLDKILTLEKKNEKNIKGLSSDIEKLARKGEKSVRKVGLVRFNPFNETGGDHSFSAALLNDENKGIVLTGLHTRERTRLYIKPIEKGKSKYDLSSEEKKAIAKAQKGKL